MKLDFLTRDFLLENEPAKALYHLYAENAPIVDYHNHLSVSDICTDRQFADIAQLWVCTDMYKFRAMRLAGLDEKYMSGPATPREKFDAWCSILPQLALNPLFHWSCLEMKNLFGLDILPSSETKDEVWEKCNALLARKDFSNNAILRKYGVISLTTSDDLLDNVDLHTEASRKSGIKVTPSLRADSALSFDKPSFRSWFARLNEDGSIKTLEDYLGALRKHLDRFHRNGCHLADHALDSGFAFVKTDIVKASRIFASLLSGVGLSAEESLQLRSFILEFLAREYATRGWVMQLHIGAERWTSSRLRSVAGPAGGYACPGGSVDVRSLCDFLDRLDSQELLPKTILYTLNPSDNEVLATLTGSFGLSGCQKLQFGPAWWYNDHKEGIERNLRALGSYSILFRSLGMTTDSRTILSFSRHEYFRRILCNYLGGLMARGELPSDLDYMGQTVLDICYRNANKWIYNEQ